MRENKRTYVIIGRNPIVDIDIVNKLIANKNIRTVSINNKLGCDISARLDFSPSDSKEGWLYGKPKYEFTHEFVLEYLRDKADTVILYGVADFNNNKYFDTDKDGYYAPCCIEYSKNKIEKEYSKYYKLYTINKDSVLDVPRIDIDKVISL